MTRDVFPFEDDRRAIQDFLLGQPCSPPHGGYVQVSAARGLRVQDTTLAWFDTAGALTISITAAYQHTAARTINYISAQLGMDDSTVRYELDQKGSTVWYVGDRQIEPSAPFVLAGPLTIQAYRASLAPNDRASQQKNIGGTG